MSDNYSWDDFKAEQRSLQRSEATTCPYCYASKVDMSPESLDEFYASLGDSFEDYLDHDQSMNY